MSSSASPKGGYFARYKEFEPDKSASLVQEFERLALARNWSTGGKRYRREKAKCVAEEFQCQYGRDVNRLDGWQRLCHDVGLEPLETTTQCRKALSSVAVNIIDLIDSRRTGTEVRVFPSKAQLRQYSRKTGRIFPREKAKADGYLKALLITM